MNKIHVWFGTGDGWCIGPLEGELVKETSTESEILITDAAWLNELELDEPIKYEALKATKDTFFRYDDYMWSFVEENLKPDNLQ